MNNIPVRESLQENSGKKLTLIKFLWERDIKKFLSEIGVKKINVNKIAALKYRYESDVNKSCQESDVKNPGRRMDVNKSS